MRPLVKLFLNALGVSIDLNSAGRVTFGFESRASDLYLYLHILPSPEFRQWGHKGYRGIPMHDFGLGPFLLVSWWGIG